MLGAPIYQAAKNEQLTSAKEARLIKANECLERYKNSMTNYTANSTELPRSNSAKANNWLNKSGGSIENKKLEYKVQDLLQREQEGQINSITINDQLELFVNPNGVAAIRLQEKV